MPTVSDIGISPPTPHCEPISFCGGLCGNGQRKQHGDLLQVMLVQEGIPLAGVVQRENSLRDAKLSVVTWDASK
tara:strand:+ start:3493 stop:3714 length:222 start_codon:yes stop_codon:yes gene_type:complete